MHPIPRAPRARAGRRRGFTLIEMMAVVLILGMLAVLFGGVVADQVDKARASNARNMLVKIEHALESYKLDNARYPTSEQGLEALVREPTSEPRPRSWNPRGYLRSADLEDPWGQPFQYEQPGQNNPYGFDLWSLGADGKPGGEGSDADVVNWEEDVR